MPAHRTWCGRAFRGAPARALSPGPAINKQNVPSKGRTWAAESARRRSPLLAAPDAAAGGVARSRSTWAPSPPSLAPSVPVMISLSVVPPLAGGGAPSGPPGVAARFALASPLFAAEAARGPDAGGSRCVEAPCPAHLPSPSPPALLVTAPPTGSPSPSTGPQRAAAAPGLGSPSVGAPRRH